MNNEREKWRLFLSFIQSIIPLSLYICHSAYSMFHSPLRFFSIIFIFTLTTKFLLADVSFGETCSDQFSCVSPLICSTNTSRCQCLNPSSMWNEEFNDCFYCLPGWIQWHDRSCVSLSVPQSGGLIYEQAKETCTLLHLSNQIDFDQFQLTFQKLLNSSFSSAVTLFFRLGAWIDYSKSLLFFSIHRIDRTEILEE